MLLVRGRTAGCFMCCALCSSSSCCSRHSGVVVVSCASVEGSVFIQACVRTEGLQLHCRHALCHMQVEVSVGYRGLQG